MRNNSNNTQEAGKDDSMKLGITGGIVLIDKQDLALVSKYKWHVNDQGYAIWRGFEAGIKKTIRMHRLILATPKVLVTDHINHNRLDNRRVNLRICTQSENMRNKRNQGKGYSYHKQSKKWAVDINGKYRGAFDTEREASMFVKLVRSGKADKKPKPERTHCKHGHSLADAYDYGKGKKCRKCQSDRSRAYYKRKKEVE